MTATPRRHLSPFAILVIAALLLLGTAASKLRIDRCVGECAVAAATPCCAATTDDGAGGECCGCCCAAPTAKATPTSTGAKPAKVAAAMVQEHLRLGGDVADEAEGAPCCVAVALGDVQFGPIDVELPNVPAVLLPPPATPTLPPALTFDARALTLPFERGPPRVDARTLLRASTVLLI